MTDIQIISIIEFMVFMLRMVCMRMLRTPAALGVVPGFIFAFFAPARQIINQTRQQSLAVIPQFKVLKIHTT